MFKACFSLPHAPQGSEVDHAYFLLLTLTKQLLFVKFCDKTAGIGSMAGQVPRKCQDIAVWTCRRA